MVIRNQILPEYVVDTIYFVIKFFVYQPSLVSCFEFIAVRHSIHMHVRELREKKS